MSSSCCTDSSGSPTFRPSWSSASAIAGMTRCSQSSSFSRRPFRSSSCHRVAIDRTMLTGPHAGLDDGPPHRPCRLADLLRVGVLHVLDRVVNDRDPQTPPGHGALDAARDDAAPLRAGHRPVRDTTGAGHGSALVVVPADVTGELRRQGRLRGHQADLPVGAVQQQPQREHDRRRHRLPGARGHRDDQLRVLTGVRALHGTLERGDQRIRVRALDVLGTDDVPREVRQAQRWLQALLQAFQQPETVLGLCRGVDLPHLVVGAPAQRVNLHGRPWRGARSLRIWSSRPSRPAR